MKYENGPIVDNEVAVGGERLLGVSIRRDGRGCVKRDLVQI